MLKSKRILRRNNAFVRVTNEIESHSSWKGEISLSEAAKLLEGQSSFTYVLSKGFDKNHFFLSFVDVDKKVKHRNVRSFIINGKTKYLNGGSGGNGGGYETIDNLVPSCLNCSASICSPL